jgi:hypothetical protein
VSFDDLPAVGRRGRSGRGEEEAAALLEGEETDVPSALPGADVGEAGGAQPPPLLRTSSDWDRTSVALKRVGTVGAFLRGEDEEAEMRDLDAPKSQAPASEAAAADGGGSTPTRRERPAGEHFTWESGEHSDDDD